MLILGILIVLMNYRIIKIKDKKLKSIVIKAIVLNLIVSILFLILLQYEIETNNGFSGTIGTDAYRYWKILEQGINCKMTIQQFNQYLKLIDYEKLKFFLLFEYTILLTSNVKSVIILKLVNIALVENILILVMSYIISIEDDIKYKNIKTVMYIMALNGGIILTSIRLLKDILLLYMLMENMYNIYKIFEERSKVHLICYIIISYFSNYVRPHSMYIFVSILLLQYWISKRYRKNFSRNLSDDITKVTLVIFVFIGILCNIPMIKNFLIATQEIALIDANSDLGSGFITDNTSILGIKSMFLRFLIGCFRTIFFPTPFKTVFMHPSFNITFFEGITGKILEVQWQIVYPITLIIFIYYIFKYISNNDYKYIPLIFFVMIQVFTYSFLYFGGVQLRWKLPLIVLITCFLYKYFSRFTKRDRMTIRILSLGYLIITYVWGITSI